MKVVGLIVGIVVLFMLRHLIGAVSVNFFTAVDHILEIHRSLSPVLMWGILGLFMGAIAGSLVMWQKYKLAMKWNFISIGVFVLFILVLAALSSPLGTKKGVASLQDHTAASMVQVTATSALPDYKQYHYKAENLIDKDLNTAWMYLPGKIGGESVRYIFEQDKMAGLTDLKLTGLQLRNGYSKSMAKWKSFNRIRGFTVYVNSTQVYSGAAVDKYNTEEDIVFNQSPVNPGDTVTVYIHSVYRGNNRKADITAVTEMVPLISFQKN